MDLDHGAVQQVPGPLHGCGRERRPAPEEDTPAVGRQAPVVEEVLRVEEHPPVGVDRRGEVGGDGFGGDHVAPDGKDTPTQPRDEPTIGRAVGGHDHFSAAQRAARRLELVSLPSPLHVQDGGRSLQHRTRRHGGPDQSRGQFGRVDSGAALDEKSPEEPARPDLTSQVRGIEEPGLLADRGVGGSERSLVARHAGMVGQLHDAPVVASRSRCRARC